jgi:hypothetical protein
MLKKTYCIHVHLLVLLRKFKYSFNARIWDILNSYIQFERHISMKSTLTNQRNDIGKDTQQVRRCLTRIFVPLSRQKGLHHEDRNIRICVQCTPFCIHILIATLQLSHAHHVWEHPKQVLPVRRASAAAI